MQGLVYRNAALNCRVCILLLTVCIWFLATLCCYFLSFYLHVFPVLNTMSAFVTVIPSAKNVVFALVFVSDGLSVF